LYLKLLSLVLLFLYLVGTEGAVTITEPTHSPVTKHTGSGIWHAFSPLTHPTVKILRFLKSSVIEGFYLPSQLSWLRITQSWKSAQKFLTGKYVNQRQPVNNTFLYGRNGLEIIKDCNNTWCDFTETQAVLFIWCNRIPNTCATCTLPFDKSRFLLSVSEPNQAEYDQVKYHFGNEFL